MVGWGERRWWCMARSTGPGARRFADVTGRRPPHIWAGFVPTGHLGGIRLTCRDDSRPDPELAQIAPRWGVRSPDALTAPRSGRISSRPVIWAGSVSPVATNPAQIPNWDRSRPDRPMGRPGHGWDRAVWPYRLRAPVRTVEVRTVTRRYRNASCRLSRAGEQGVGGGSRSDFAGRHRRDRAGRRGDDLRHRPAHPQGRR